MYKSNHLPETSGRIEAALEAERSFRRAIERALGGGIAAIDARGRQVYVNEAFCEMLGWPAEELTGAEPPYIYWCPEEIPAITAAMQQTLRNEAPPEGFELRFRRRNGDVFWAQVRVIPIEDTVPDGRRWLASVTDVTDRKRAAAALCDTKMRLEAILDNTAACIFAKDLEGRYTVANESFLQLWGWRREEVLGHTDFELHTPSMAKEYVANDRSVLESGRPMEFEELAQLSNGLRTYLMLKFPLVDQGDTVSGVCGIATDITHRKRTEDQLRRQNERLQLISEAAAELLGAKGTDELLKPLLERVSAHLNVDVYASYSLDETENRLKLVCCSGVSEEMQARLECLRMGEGLCGRVAEQRSPLIAAGVQNSTDAPAQLARALGLRSYAGFPLMAGERLLGTLAFASCTRDCLGEDELDFIQAISHYVAMAKERARVEQALRHQLDLTRTITANATAALFMMNEHGRCTFMNRAAEEMTGYTFAEMREQPVHEMIHHHRADGQPYPIEECPIDRALPEGIEVREHEDMLIRKNGEFFPVLCAARPIVENGRPIGTVIEFRDMTDRHRMDALQTRQKQVLESICSEAPLAVILELLCQVVEEQAEQDCVCSIMLVDPDGKRLRHGAAPHLPQSYCDALDGIAVDPNAGTCCAAAARNEVVYTPDIANDPFWADVKELPLNIGLRSCWSMPIRSSRGLVIGTFGTYFRTCRLPAAQEQQLVEILAHTASIAIERKQAEERLRRSEQLYRGIGESINYGVWVSEPDGRSVYHSASFLKLVGLTQEECAGFGWTRVLHPDDANTIIARWKECVRTGTSWECEYRVRGADNQWHHVLSRGVPIRDDQQELLCWAGIHLDIARLKKTEDALKEADRRKDEFLATLAHELRNPLASISNAVDLLQFVSEDRRALEDLRQVMSRQVKQMVRLIDDLLDVSRISRGRIELRKEVIDLHQAVNAAVEAIKPLVHRANQKLLVPASNSPMRLRGDLARLTQIVSNLLSNAVKYTPAGGEIHVIAEREGSDAVLRIRDTGIGIPPNKLAFVFELFAQLDRSLEGNQEGLGIGLTLVKSLVDMHGGSITAHSRGQDLGSEFVVRLPLMIESAPSSEILLSSLAPQPEGYRFQVLVVEDSAAVGDIFAMMLRTLGHEVRLARSGHAALESLCEFAPDVVFSDISMPGMNGYELVKKLKELRLPAHLVALTGYGQAEDRQLALDAGFDSHLVKPADFEDLQALFTRLAEDKIDYRL